MEEAFSRTGMLLGPEGLRRLRDARVAVFGLGGVGGCVAEALARSGVGALDLVDSDVVAPSNLNRQLIAAHSTLGMYKTDAAERRIRDINPDCVVTKHRVFFGPETVRAFDFTRFDYVADAIDTVTGKLQLVLLSQAAKVPVISAMGAGNKLDPTAFRVADIYDTAGCPLARVMRRELRKRGVKALKVVYSQEPPLPPLPGTAELGSSGHPVPGSCAFVPTVAGFILAGEIVKDLALGPGHRRPEPGQWQAMDK